MAIIVQDNFNRADSTSVLGSPQIGPAPTIVSGTWGISGNQAYTSAVGSNGSVVVWECGTPNVDITLKRTVTQTAGGPVLAVNTSLDLWQALFSNDFTTAPVEGGLIRFFGASFAWGYGVRGRCSAAVNAAAVLRVIHFNGLVEMWADSTLIARGQVPEALTLTKHGIRASTTQQKYDDITISDAPDITLPVKTGQVREHTFGLFAQTLPSKDAFLYRGRDTKAQDTAGVS